MEIKNIFTSNKIRYFILFLIFENHNISTNNRVISVQAVKVLEYTWYYWGTNLTTNRGQLIAGLGTIVFVCSVSLWLFNNHAV